MSWVRPNDSGELGRFVRREKSEEHLVLDGGWSDVVSCRERIDKVEPIEAIARIEGRDVKCPWKDPSEIVA
jgi:hypothetical protein